MIRVPFDDQNSILSSGQNVLSLSEDRFIYERIPFWKESSAVAGSGKKLWNACLYGQADGRVAIQKGYHLHRGYVKPVKEGEAAAGGKF